MRLLLDTHVKVQSGKVTMRPADLDRLIENLALKRITFSHIHPERMLSMPLHHPDPFHRMIIATALAEDLTLVGSDRNFARYKGLKKALVKPGHISRAQLSCEPTTLAI